MSIDYPDVLISFCSIVRRKMRPRTHSAYSVRAGGDQSKVWSYYGFGVFQSRTDQVWSPALTERRREIGIVLFGLRIGVSDAWNI